MKMKTLALIAALALLSATTEAQVKRTVAKLPTAACTAGNIENTIYIVTDADNLADCTSGGGTSSALCICDGGSFVSLAGTTVADMAGSYILITKAGQQSLSATGAGNDVTVNAADDVILVPTDALTVTPGGAAAITTTAGAITLTAGGTTQDVSLVSVDDVILTPTDDLTVNAADIAMTATATAGLTAGTTLSLAGTTAIAFDAAGGTDELGIAENAVSVSAGIAFRLVGGSAPPAACAAGTKGTIYYDTDINKLCVCNATAYVLVDDATTTTGCS